MFIDGAPVINVKSEEDTSWLIIGSKHINCKMITAAGNPSDLITLAKTLLDSIPNILILECI